MVVQSRPLAALISGSFLGLILHRYEAVQYLIINQNFVVWC